MQKTTLTTIENILRADPEIYPDQIQGIINACRTPIVRKKLINARQAMEILDVSRPTLSRLVEAGKLSQVKTSPRKIRFDLAEVERLAYTVEPSEV